MSVLANRPPGNSVYHDIASLYHHVVDPNERRRLALAEIDKSPFGWYHVRAVVVAGIGFFTDAYDIFAINLVTIMFGLVFWQNSNGGVMPSSSETAIKVAASGGAVVGQVAFGYLADLLGRKRMYGIELMIIIASTITQSLTAPSTSMSFVGLVIFWRVAMGIGIGGDYPLSAVITSEFANTKWRGSMIGAVFAMQGLGQFAAAMMTLVVTVGFKESLEPIVTKSSCGPDCQKDVDIMWRIILGFGAVPGWFALYYRLTIPETPRYTFDVKHDLVKGAADTRAFHSGKRRGQTDPRERARVRQDVKEKYHTRRPTLSDFVRYFSRWRNALTLFGTAGSWFFLDVAFYGLSLNNASILDIIGYSSSDNIYRILYNNAVGNLVIVCAGSIPGYWVTVLTVDILGRKTIQIAGFTILTLLFAIIGFRLYDLSSGSLLALYILCQFFFNFGPNATTFITPAEVYPTRLRTTCHGISAAAGKVGAIIAQVVFAPMASRGAPPKTPPADPSSTDPTTPSSSHGPSAADPWLNNVMKIFALFMFCGIFTSFMIPESKRMTLEELAGENEKPLFELSFVSNFFKDVYAPDTGRWRWRKRHTRREKANGKRRADEDEEGANANPNRERVVVRATEWPFLPLDEMDAWRAMERERMQKQRRY